MILTLLLVVVVVIHIVLKLTPLIFGTISTYRVYDDALSVLLPLIHLRVLNVGRILQGTTKYYQECGEGTSPMIRQQLVRQKKENPSISSG